jgi:CYTH domain-containing protein
MNMSNGLHLEIERKFLIERPDEALLSGISGAVRYEIEQIYLPGDDRITERIRMRKGAGGAEYYHTFKKQLSDLSRVEDEVLISEEEYDRLKNLAGANPMKIEKTRWCIPYGNLFIEVDIYQFWQNSAIAEVELEREDSHFAFPDFIHVVREVTHDGSFTNKALAAALRSGKIREPDAN